MRVLLILVLFLNVVGCANLKYRWKNYNGERSQAQMEKDYQECYQYTQGPVAYNKCIEKKGYYAEAYEE